MRDTDGGADQRVDGLAAPGVSQRTIGRQLREQPDQREPVVQVAAHQQIVGRAFIQHAPQIAPLMAVAVQENQQRAFARCRC